MHTNLHIAKWWKKTKNDKILCTLCPRFCTISEGQKGFCFVRENIGGVLYSTGYGRPTGFAIDPIEKKPLHHFYPGSSILSFGTAGCNLGCKFCQNWITSKAQIDEVNSLLVKPEDVIDIAKENNVKSIAFTYNDPTIFGEFVIDVSKLARQEGIKTVMVTAGYIDKRARKEIYEYIDAANVDLKAFTEDFYWNYTASHLNDVLATLIWLKEETNVWLEITTLLIPQLNDSAFEIENMCKWIIKNLGEDVPMHFTAFHPAFRFTNIKATLPATVIGTRQIALDMGIKYVYVGNILDKEGQNTYCSSCGEIIISRNWHSMLENKIIDGKCFNCKTPIVGWF
ncbi:MAG: AmmeMemoRadiSam system radical SAM enzyme [bacterium]